MKQSVKISALFTLLIFIFLFHACQRKKPETGSSSTATRPVEVKAVIAEPRELENKIMTTGTLLANEEVEIRAEVPGRVTGIFFQEGSFAGKGELLLQINDNELRAQLKKLELDEKLAADDVFRKEKLLELKAISQEELDIALNQLGVIRAGIELVKSQIEKTRIFAPFSGRIGLRYVSPGGFISSSDLVARLQQTDPVKVEFSIPEKYILNVSAGMDIQFTTEGTGRTFTGTVYAIESRIDPSTRSFTARAKCPNPENALTPGAFARITLILEKVPGALVLPSEAIIPDLAGKKVMLVKNGRVKTVLVETGIHTEHEVQVRSGINPMDTVLISGLLVVREGMPVIPRLTEIK